MVQSKADRERKKLITDKCQSLIEALLKDEDNKYCVDCDAKGPRWASWNLGVFLCIRCAGIHRNLGVHISKVKSVNLDAWTPEHVAYVQRMGNSRARAIYEANLPDDFRRPQTDTALESFIRAKYEHKKYIAQDYVEPGLPEPEFNIDDELKKMKEQKKSKVAGAGSSRLISVTELPGSTKARPNIQTTTPAAIKNKTVPTTSPALFDLETVEPATEVAVSSSDQPKSEQTSSNNKSLMDLLIGLDLNASSAADEVNQTTSSQQTEGPSQSLIFTDSPAPTTASTPAKSAALSASISRNIDLDLDFSTPVSAQSAPLATETSSTKVLTKESILSLYSSSAFGNVGGTTTNAATDPFGAVCK